MSSTLSAPWREEPWSAGDQNAAPVSLDFAVGDEIQAWHRGKVYFQGRVLSLIPSLSLVTIKCRRTGAARLIDASVLEVTRASPLITPSNVGHIPVFQEQDPQGTCLEHNRARE